MAKEDTILNELVRVSNQTEESVKAEYGISSRYVVKVLKRLVYRELREEIETEPAEEVADEPREPVTPRVKRERKPILEPQPELV